MKILIAINIYLGAGRAGGSETWATTMKAELERIGHDVTLTSSKDGGRDFEGDLALIAHTSNADLMGLKCRKIYTCHGVIPALEQPIPGADAYVAVSEEVRDAMAAKGYNAQVIRNPINTELFVPTDPPRPEADKILFYSRYGGDHVRRKLHDAFGERLGYSSSLGHVLQPQVPAMLNTADIVVGLGRSALEAMSCARNVIVYDYNGGDGMVTPDTMLEFRKNNCSGRRYAIDFSAAELERIASGYDPKRGEALRRYVIENNCVRKIAKQYLSL